VGLGPWALGTASTQKRGLGAGPRKAKRARLDLDTGPLALKRETTEGGTWVEQK